MKHIQVLFAWGALMYGALIFNNDPMKSIMFGLVAIFCMLGAIFMAITEGGNEK